VYDITLNIKNCLCT